MVEQTSATKGSAASAGVWSALDITLRQGVLFVVSIVLARLLEPSDFGLIALVTFFTSLSTVFVQSGLTTALIQRQQTSLAEESAIFWFNLAAGALFGLLLVAAGPAVAAFYGFPLLQLLMALAGLQVFVAAFGAVQTALLTRELRFAQLTKVGVLASVLSGVAALVAAALGAGIWSLAIQMMLATAVNSAALWIVSRWRPAFQLRLASIRSMLGFGFWVSLSSTLDVLYTHGFALLLGKLHGMRELGFYGRAANTQQLPSTILTSIIARVALPMFSSRSADLDGMRRGVRAANSISMLLNVPALLGLAILAEPVIEVLFGPKWLPAADILRILAIAGLFFPLHIINLNVVLAQGNSRRFFRMEITKKLVGLCLVLAGSFFGVIGLAWSQVLASFVALVINVAPTRRSLGYGLGRQMLDLAGIFFAAGMMGLAVALGAHVLVAPTIVELPILVATGIIVYAGVGFGLRLRSFAEALDVLRHLAPRVPMSEAG